MKSYESVKPLLIFINILINLYPFLQKMNDKMNDKINETFVQKNNSVNNKTTEATDASTIPFCQMYEKRLTEYMKSIPHIPPTQFELRLRHNDLKVDIIKQFKNMAQKSKPLALKQLENQIDRIYNNLSKKNVEEYKRCQAGFTIGWKCNVNKPQAKPQTTDDRF